MYFCIFCATAAPSEANLQLSCQLCWLPNKEWHVPAGWRDAAFEPGNAGFTVWCTTIEPPHPTTIEPPTTWDVVALCYINPLGDDLPGYVAEDEDGHNVDDDPGQVHLAVTAPPQVMARESARQSIHISKAGQTYFEK